MSIEIKYVQDGQGVIVTGSGVLTEEEYVSTLKKHLTQDKDKFKKIRYYISDYTAVTEVEVSTKAIELIAKFCMDAAIVNPDTVVATVANENLQYGLARMSETLRAAANWESMVFRSREDAEAWIKERVKDKYGIDDLTFG